MAENVPPTNAADATDEVNQRQEAHKMADVEQGVVPAPPIETQPDERVPQQPLNSTVGQDQPVTEPANRPDDGQSDVQPNPEPTEEPSN